MNFVLCHQTGMFPHAEASNLDIGLSFTALLTLSTVVLFGAQTLDKFEFRKKGGQIKRVCFQDIAFHEHQS